MEVVYLCRYGGGGEAAIPVSCKLHMVMANGTYRFTPSVPIIVLGRQLQHVALCSYQSALISLSCWNEVIGTVRLRRIYK